MLNPRELERRLGVVVGELEARVRQLCEEKQKTEDLLHRMLPPSVARKLTQVIGTLHLVVTDSMISGHWC